VLPVAVWAAFMVAGGVAMVVSTGLAMAAMIGLVFIVVYSAALVIRALAYMTPGLRDILPEERVNPEDLSAIRLEAEEEAKRIAAEIEAEVKAAREAEAVLEAMRPKSLLEAQQLLTDARAAVEAAAASVEAAEHSAKAKSGGWMAVAEARQALRLAEENAAEVESLASPLLLESPAPEKSMSQADCSSLFRVPSGGNVQTPQPMHVRGFAAMARDTWSTSFRPPALPSQQALRVRRTRQLATLPLRAWFRRRI